MSPFFCIGLVLVNIAFVIAIPVRPSPTVETVTTPKPKVTTPKPKVTTPKPKATDLPDKPKPSEVVSSEEISVESEIDTDTDNEVTDKDKKDRDRGKSNKLCLIVANQVKALMALPNEKKRRGEAFMQALQKKVTFLSMPDAKKGDVMKALTDIMELMPKEDEINALKEEKGKASDEKEKEINALKKEKGKAKKKVKALHRKKTEEALPKAGKRKWVVKPGESRIVAGDNDVVQTASSSQDPSLVSLMRDFSELCHKEFKAED